METLFNWLHIAAVVIWLGGLSFLLLAMWPSAGNEAGGVTPSAFLMAAKRFRPYMWTAMGLVAVSGVYQIVQAGGMRNLAVVIHIKLAIALVMFALSLFTSMWLLPRMLKTGPEGETVEVTGNVRVYVLLSALVLVLGLVIFWLLSAAQRF